MLNTERNNESDTDYPMVYSATAGSVVLILFLIIAGFVIHCKKKGKTGNKDIICIRDEYHTPRYLQMLSL